MIIIYFFLFFFFLENKDKLMLDLFIDETLDKIDLLHKNFQEDIYYINNKSNEKIAQIFTVIQANLNHELVNKTGAIFQFNVKGTCQIKYYFFFVCFRNIN